jgi:uncharacterized membrane protein YdfJ with MMPL/SSD domain
MDLVLRAPLAVVVVLTLPCLALGVWGANAPRDLSFTGIMNRDHPLVAAYYKTSRELLFAGRMPVLLEGPDEKLDDAARALKAPLDALDSVAAVVAEPPAQWLKAHAPYLVEPAIFDDWLRLATHPEDGEAATRLADALSAAEKDTLVASPEGARLVLVRMAEDPLDLPAGGETYLEIERTAQEVLERHGVRGNFTGLPAIAAQDQSRTFKHVRTLSPLSLLLVLFLFRFVERRFTRLIAVATPMLLTVSATLGLVALITDGLTMMETFFGVMVFGLGVDFALHLMVRFREERARGRPFEEALRTTWWGTGVGVVAGALTTTGAFAIVGLAPDPLALHLGVSGAIGLFVCLVLMMALLPAFWIILERWRPSQETAVRELPVPGLRAVVEHATRHPRAHVVLSLLLIAAGLWGAPRYRFETDLQKVFNRQVPALSAMERIQERFGVNPGPWLVVTDSLEEAARVSDAMKAEGLFSRVDSAVRLLRPDREPRRARLQAAAQDIGAQRKVYEALRELSSDDERTRLEGAIEALTVLDDAAKAGPPREATLPATFRDELLAPGGRYVVYGYVKSPTIDGAQARQERAIMQRIHPDAVGFGFLLEAVMADERPWVWSVLFGIFGFVAFVLLVDLRRPRLMILAIAPVVFGTTVTFGALCWAQLDFNVLTTLVVPLIIGLGVDDGIHVVHRLREGQGESVVDATCSVGRAIVMTTATTCTSFATLLFTDHAGLEGMAIVLMVGLPLCLWASVTLVPALAVLLGVGQSESSE